MWDTEDRTENSASFLPEVLFLTHTEVICFGVGVSTFALHYFVGCKKGLFMQVWLFAPHLCRVISPLLVYLSLCAPFCVCQTEYLGVTTLWGFLCFSSVYGMCLVFQFWPCLHFGFGTFIIIISSSGLIQSHCWSLSYISTLLIWFPKSYLTHVSAYTELGKFTFCFSAHGTTYNPL